MFDAGSLVRGNVKRSAYSSKSSGDNETKIVGPGCVGLGVGDRFPLAPEDADSNEAVRGLELGGDSVSEGFTFSVGGGIDFLEAEADLRAREGPK